MTVTVFRYLIINVDELRFCFSFLFLALVSTDKIYQTLEACFSIQKFSFDTPLRVVFLILYKMFRIVMKHCFLCLI